MGGGGGVLIPRRGLTENFNMAEINNLAIPGGGGGSGPPVPPPPLDPPMKLLPLLTFIQWKKPYSKLFSGIKFLFVNRFSNFCHFLRFLEFKMVTWQCFLFIFEKSEILKNAFSGRW